MTGGVKTPTVKRRNGTMARRPSKKQVSEVEATIREIACASKLFFGVKEVSDELRVAAPNLRDIKDLPEPVMKVAATPLWLASDIRAFSKVYETRRRTRRAAA